eukprot:COSAG01_NODE_6169_length_3814_cov_2.140781_4_plen_60_part_00
MLRRFVWWVASRYHLNLWRDHARAWIERMEKKPTLVVRMEDFKADCVGSLGRALDFLEV